MTKTQNTKKNKVSNNKFRNSNNGITLIWTILICTILLTISFTMVLLVVNELRISSNIDESGRAYTAAEAGMETALYRVKTELAANSAWCPAAPVTIPKELIPAADGLLNYNAVITVSNCAGLKQIAITSQGISRNTTIRKLKNTITTTTTDNINVFDLQPTYAGNPYNNNRTYYDFPASVSGSNPYIIQQFDLTNLDVPEFTPGLGKSFEVGMSNGNSTDFYILFEKPNANRLDLSIKGNLNGSAVSSSTQTISVSAANQYRARLEYSRYGSGVTGYTVLRASILEKDPATGNWVTIANSTPLHVGVQARGEDVNFVKVYSNNPLSEWIDPAIDPTLGGYIKTVDGVRVDNMTLWYRN